MTACDPCLRRAGLLRSLAGPIDRSLRERRSRPSGMLALPDDELVEAVAGGDRARVEAERDGFDPACLRAQLESIGVAAVCRHADLYPTTLDVLDDPPAVLFARAAPGRLEQLLGERLVAIVGARRCSSYGAEVAESLGRGLSAAGVTVVSGLALGIDAAAHRGAAAAGTNAIAVLASGADVPYPRSHRSLYESICAGGAVVSELPPGTRPYRWSFPARNRIMAALTEITVVVEAAEGSGSLITTSFAQQIGREVAAVPGRVTHRGAAGATACSSTAAPRSGPLRTCST